MINNLLNSIRQPMVFTKLPCGKNWYKNNEISFLLNDEVSVLPMTHRDELLIHNPDALFSNNAVAEVIKSCIPEVNDVNHILMPDVEVLLLAIKIASVGDDIEFSSICPNCLKKYNSLSIEEREKLIAEHKLNIEPQTFLFDARRCLETLSFKNDTYLLELSNGIKVDLMPVTLENNSTNEILNFETKNAIKQFILDNDTNSIEENAEMILEINKWKENKEKNDNFNKLLIQLDNIAIDSIISSIKSVTIQNTIFTDKKDIKEFLNKIPSPLFNDIRNEINKINETALDKTCFCKCRYCNHEWEKNDLELNFSNFFVSGS